jgi:CRP/FNR family cyclic AMP-dependent transcriptional regulator
MLHRDHKMDLIKAVPLFTGCSKRELRQIAMMADEIDFKPGKVLIKEGSPGKEFFVLVRGLADVSRRGELLDTVGPGAFFGEMSLLADEPRNATVTTVSEVDTLVLTAANFKRLVTTNPLIGLKVMRAVAERVPPDSLS